ncbi:MAG: hypothetical protein IKL75_03500 [Bacteroidaceae bacterium]|nr:hypothetical protein [Bacteroidaceae bacterium]
MKLFKTREPRKFNHRYIFVDERKEKIDRIMENAKRDLGMLPPKEQSYEERIRGAFTEDNSHLARHKERGPRISSRYAVGGIMICLFILYYLLKDAVIVLF